MFRNPIARFLLWPFSLVYGFMVGIRNLLYEARILKSSRFSLPIISIGNLAVGGAGKTPHVEHLIRLLQPYINVGTLSRGYNRSTKGFRFVTQQDNANQSGDEPLMYAKKYPDVVVAVCESRALAIPEMVKYHPELQAILLDDAFQHRSVVPDINVLLTQYEHPYTRDTLMPAGRLREDANAAERADIVIVTKCPPDLNKEDAAKIKTELALVDYQSLYFSTYQYGNPYSFFDPNHRINLAQQTNVLFLSAIANTNYLYQYADTFDFEYSTIEYADHHYFSGQDIKYISQKYNEGMGGKGIIICTEKDAMRLAIFYKVLAQAQLPIFVLPIQVSFLFDESQAFNQEIQNRLLELEK